MTCESAQNDETKQIYIEIDPVSLSPVTKIDLSKKRIKTNNNKIPTENNKEIEEKNLPEENSHVPYGIESKAEWCRNNPNECRRKQKKK